MHCAGWVWVEAVQGKTCCDDALGAGGKGKEWERNEGLGVGEWTYGSGTVKEGILCFDQES